MGVYIKGMEMPLSCESCRFDDGIFCHAYPESENFMYDIADGIPEWCPLIEVPPHGDLIDRDALSNDGWTLHKEVMVMGGFAIHELPLKNPTIPVIIESEGEENE